MTKRFSLAFLAAAFATAIIIAAAASIPALLFAEEDETLYHSPLNRHREAGALSPEGEDLYLVRTLYARAEQLQKGGAGYLPETPDLDDLRRQVTPVFNEMAKNGILPAGLSAELGIILERDDSLTGYSVDSAGFTQALFSGDGNGAVHSFGFEREPLTGLIVNIWINTAHDLEGQAAGYDAGLALEAYRAWLGLQELDDWQNGDSGYYSYEQSSQKGRMKLYLLAQGRLLHLGAVSIFTDTES